MLCNWHRRQDRGDGTSRVNDQAAVPVADLEVSALYAQRSDLAFLQQVLQSREVLDAPHEPAAVAVAGAALGLTPLLQGRAVAIQVSHEVGRLL